MLVECSQCKTKYKVIDEKLKPKGSKFKCSKCGAIFYVKNPATAVQKGVSQKTASVSPEKHTGNEQESPGKKERRKHKRYPFREEILIDGTKRCTCTDISEIGLYVSTIQSFEENDFIQVTIPFKDKDLTVKAQVKYCQPGIGMGIMFIDLTDEQKIIIKEIIKGIE